MINSIEELEKELNKFHNNIISSNELYEKLDSVIDGIKVQRKEFEEKSQAFQADIDGLPSRIEEISFELNRSITDNIGDEYKQLLHDFELVQKEYINKLEETKEEVIKCSKSIHEAEASFVSHVNDTTNKLNGILSNIQDVPARISDDTMRTLSSFKISFDQMLSNQMIKFSEEHGKYTSSMQNTQNQIERISSELDLKYKSFISDIERMNLSGLYEQNQRMHDTINKKLIIAIAVAAVASLASIVSIFL